MKRTIALLLTLALVSGLAPCHASTQETAVHTPEESPFNSAYTGSQDYYIYDTVKGVWDIWAKTPEGAMVQKTAYVRVEEEFPSSWAQPIAFEEPSMDRPMFICFYDSDHNQTYFAHKVLTGHDVFTSGGIGTPESTGVIDLSYCCSDPDYGIVRWTLKDGVLIVTGGSHMAFNNCGVMGNSPFTNNPYIRTIIWDSGSFFDCFYFDGCENLENIIVLKGDGGVGSKAPNYIRFRTAEDKTQVLSVTEPFGKNVDTPLIMEMSREASTRGWDDTYGNLYGDVKSVSGREVSLVIGSSTTTHAAANNAHYEKQYEKNPGFYDRGGGLAAYTATEWPGALPQYIQNAHLTQEAADYINAASARYGYGFTVTANTSGAVTPIESIPLPTLTEYDPAATNGGSAANPICGSWAREDVITAWNLFSDRIPYLKENGPRTNLIEKDLTQPITRAEFATLAVAAYDYILGDTAPNDGYGSELDERSLAAGGVMQELSMPKQSDLSTHMTDLWIDGTPHYYLDGVQACICMGLMIGYSDIRFGMDDHLNREQAATVLGRIADRYSGWQYRLNPAQSTAFPQAGANPYLDPISRWALDGVLRAREANIMIGISDVSFSASSDFTREQALVALLRMVNYCKPWYRALSNSELASKAVHLAANPEGSF